MNTFYKWLFSKSSEKLEQEAKVIYQIKEFDGEIWLTFNGALVCPCVLLMNEPVEALNTIRKLYVKRNTIEET